MEPFEAETPTSPLRLEVLSEWINAPVDAGSFEAIATYLREVHDVAAALRGLDVADAEVAAPYDPSWPEADA